MPVAAPAADTLAYGPAPEWIVAQQAPPAISGEIAPVRVLLTDVQMNLAPTTSESYSDTVLLIQTPQGLAKTGTITLSWRPETDAVTVHKLTILRDDKKIDVLGSGQTFSIMRREDKLEYAALSGVLTAVIQPEGLQVGDRLEFAFTLERTDTLLGGVPEQVVGTAPGVAIARAHLRARWPADYKMNWRASTFLDGLKESRLGDSIEVTTTRDNDEPLVQPAGAPARFAVLRELQFTGFKSWSEVSKLLFPLFDRASKLSPTSPLQAELARIRAAAPDARSRTEVALRLVQDQIRFVYLGMNDARIVPADVETTWSRRYGDCKAKTALLLALLRELKVDAEPVAVNTVAGDALPTRLPMIAMFNHVLVRAILAGKTYWLDGTRLGDRRLDDLAVPNFRWGLPLTAGGAELLKIEAVPLSTPMLETAIAVDASAGASAPASFQVEATFRADAATALQNKFSDLTATQRDGAVRALWTQQSSQWSNWSEVTLGAVKADFDDALGILRLSAEGQGMMNWQGDAHLLGSLSVGNLVDYKREPGPNSDAPFLTNFPSYIRTKERIKLPRAGMGFSIVGDDVDRTIAGVHYQRSARIDKDELVGEASIRSMEPEFPASEAPAAQKVLHELWDHPLYAKLPARESGPSALLTDSLGGVRLGMTEDELSKLKGNPISKSNSGWLYNTVDSRHDGVLTAWFAKSGEGTTPVVAVIDYVGNEESAPAELPFLKGQIKDSLVQKYGEPVSQDIRGDVARYYFNNGVFIIARGGKVMSYGIARIGAGRN
jgi:transglutaminase-like putative cysteine protease